MMFGLQLASIVLIISFNSNKDHLSVIVNISYFDTIVKAQPPLKEFEKSQLSQQKCLHIFVENNCIPWNQNLSSQMQ